MRPVVGAIFTLLPGIFLSPPSAYGMCATTSFEMQLSRAEVVFGGTVLGVEPVARLWNIPGTRYRFGRIRYAKGGGREDTLIVEQMAGPAAPEYLVEDEVQFNVGTRYIVFAGRWPQGRSGQLHASGCGVGALEIAPDPGFATAVVHVYGGSVAAFDDRHIIVVRHGPDQRPAMGIVAVGPGGRLTLPSPLPRMGVPDLLRVTDSLYEERQRRGNPTDWRGSRTLRWTMLSSEQDPGVRVGEEEFLRVITAMAKRLPASGVDSTGAR